MCLSGLPFNACQNFKLCVPFPMCSLSAEGVKSVFVQKYIYQIANLLWLRKVGGCGMKRHPLSSGSDCLVESRHVSRQSVNRWLMNEDKCREQWDHGGGSTPPA